MDESPRMSPLYASHSHCLDLPIAFYYVVSPALTVRSATHHQGHSAHINISSSQLNPQMLHDTLPPAFMLVVTSEE